MRQVDIRILTRPGPNRVVMQSTLEIHVKGLQLVGGQGLEQKLDLLFCENGERHRARRMCMCPDAQPETALNFLPLLQTRWRMMRSRHGPRCQFVFGVAC